MGVVAKLASSAPRLWSMYRKSPTQSSLHGRIGLPGHPTMPAAGRWRPAAASVRMCARAGPDRPRAAASGPLKAHLARPRRVWWRAQPTGTISHRSRRAALLPRPCSELSADKNTVARAVEDLSDPIMRARGAASSRRASKNPYVDRWASSRPSRMRAPQGLAACSQPPGHDPSAHAFGPRFAGGSCAAAPPPPRQAAHGAAHEWPPTVVEHPAAHGPGGRQGGRVAAPYTAPTRRRTGPGPRTHALDRPWVSTA